jgi:mono/diheme cytochrome c family protein
VSQPRGSELNPLPFKFRQLGCAALAISSCISACQQTETAERIQDDTTQKESGGAPTVSQPSPSHGGGEGGSAGSHNEQEPERDAESQELPCEIEEIFAEYCFKCHADRIEPRLNLYAAAVIAAPLIRGALVGTGLREMPPRETLPDDMRQTIVAWIKSGTPPAPPNASCP